MRTLTFARSRQGAFQLCITGFSGAEEDSSNDKEDADEKEDDKDECTTG